jgi:uncharacterized protein DUF6221
MVGVMDPYEPDEVMDRCRVLAWKTYQADGILSHERVADELGRFVAKRITEYIGDPSRTALLSVVAREVRTATYLSCGQKAIAHALANLIRLALPYADHPDYQESWKP